VFIVILSPDAMNSQWVQDEIAIAWNQKNKASKSINSQKLFLPLYYRPCEVSEDLQIIQGVSFLPSGTYQQGLREVLDALEQFLSPSFNKKQSVIDSSPRHFTRRNVLIAGGVLGVGSLGGWELLQLARTHGAGNASQWANKYTKHKTSVWTVAWAPNGKLVASVEAGKDSNQMPIIRVWNALSSDDVWLYSELNPATPPHQVTWSPDGASLAIGVRDGVAYSWNIGTSASQGIYGKPVVDNYVMCLDWSPDGTRLACGRFQHVVEIWDIKKQGIPVAAYVGHARAIRSLAWSPDGQYIASASDDQTVQVWDAKTLKQLCIYRHVGSTTAVAWSADGKLLASACVDLTVHTWLPDPPAGKLLHIHKGHQDVIAGVAWSPDSRRVVSVSVDRKAHVWNASQSDEQLYIYMGHTDKIRTVSWSKRTGYIATAGDDTTVQIWRDSVS